MQNDVSYIWNGMYYYGGASSDNLSVLLSQVDEIDNNSRRYIQHPLISVYPCHGGGTITYSPFWVHK